MANFATIEDLEVLFRELNETERVKAEKLLEVVSDSLREEGYKVGIDLDEKLELSPSFESVLKSVVCDVIGRNINTSTTAEPMTQMTESALGYSVSGSYLVPGGGLFIKNAELARLGLKRQRIKSVQIC